MNLLVWLVVGGLVGWIAGLLLQSSGNGILINVVIGIVGSFIGGWLLGPMFHAGTINQHDFSLAGLAVSLLGGNRLVPLTRCTMRLHPNDEGKRADGAWRS
ncbi:MAG TPA: GlsB/YeaQ/YmgE family stress response membrane protein [Burkholderiaceae bacterium]|nr:GlsB/YeaQ/YmgE family stress response membrane protein [Burkholderiaceae bacterium]